MRVIAKKSGITHVVVLVPGTGTVVRHVIDDVCEYDVLTIKLPTTCMILKQFPRVDVCTYVLCNEWVYIKN